ncbi:MAG: helix-turn-helix domain-containing protein [Kiloniellales bacterium]|nr:helix-turn-helix domain-containing protein [Kiloniellales bacterium]
MGRGETLSLLRRKLGLTQLEMARRMNVSLRAYQNYERGQRAPTADHLEPLALTGINVNWLLTGEGPMYQERSGARAMVGIDEKLLSDCIQALEEALDRMGLTISHDKKGEAIALVYELNAQREGGVDSGATQAIAERLIRALSA